MSATKTLRGNTTIWAARPESFPDWSVPLSAAKFATSLAAGLIVEISAAVEDSYTLNLTGSTTDNSQSVVDIAKNESPLTVEYEAAFSLFRNKPGTIDTPIYDIALALFDGIDVPYFLIKRLDKAQGAIVASGDILSAYGVTTDYGADAIKNDAMLMYDVRFKTTGGVNTNFTVAV